MPRVYLSFKLPEENEEFEIAFAGHNYKYVLEDLDNFLRNKLKYDGDLHEKYIKVYQEVRDKLHEICKERGLA